MAGPRTILHADMDAFYASVEQRDNPDLQGKPVVVGGPSRRGVVSAASYEARVFGIHSAMPMARALKLCPHLVALPPRIRHYAEISTEVFDILRRYSPLVEPLSLDEAFVDVTGTERLHGEAWQVAKAIKREVRERLRLVVSVGVGPSKFVAKLASDLGKPDGLVLVAPEELERFLHPLPVSRIFGVGRVTLKALGRMGIATIGDLAAFPAEVLRTRFGEHGDHLWSLARGIDDREVVPERQAKSIGHENTFAEDRGDPGELRRILLEQADRVARRLRRHQLKASVVVLKAKTPQFKLLTRRRTLPRPTSDGGVIGKVAGELLTELMHKHPGPFRLTGVTGAGLVPEREVRQLALDEPVHQQRDELARTLDTIAERYGQSAVRRASMLPRDRSKREPPEE